MVLYEKFYTVLLGSIRLSVRYQKLVKKRLDLFWNPGIFLKGMFDAKEKSFDRSGLG